MVVAFNIGPSSRRSVGSQAPTFAACNMLAFISMGFGMSGGERNFDRSALTNANFSAIGNFWE